MKSIVFEKWEGLANDFVVVDASTAPLSWWVEAAPRICDRRRGVGADGILLVERRVAANNAPRMVVLNADGSRPQMCGNGLRCVAASLCLQGGGPTLEVMTDAGLRTCRVQSDASPYQVTIDMGVIGFPRLGDAPTQLASSTLGAGYVANAGNPHWIFLDAPADARLEDVGAVHEIDERFPERTNVEVVRRRGPGAWDVKVWERGVGLTHACGTGAAAVAGLLVALGIEPPDAPLQIALPGGELELVVDADSGRVHMKGPARQAFFGEIRPMHYGSVGGRA